MAPTYWMISNRKKSGSTLSKRMVLESGVDTKSRLDDMNYWTSSKEDLAPLRNWEEHSAHEFKKTLLDVTDKFPLKDEAQHQEQKHVTLFIHGYNNDWQEAVRTYQRICAGLNGMGLVILFTWPSDGSKLGYLPDRKDARASAPDLAEILNSFYDWLIGKQKDAQTSKACRAKVSVIAHSMGNYVLQKAMQYSWSRNNQPLLVSLVNQLLMIGADVDNDLFKGGESTDKSDGDAIANLTYRVTALYSGLDTILGMSAGMKHFGKRRLGRAGLDRAEETPDNVWDVDCTPLFQNYPESIHSAYFHVPACYDLMKQVMKGIDRGHINSPAIPRP